MDDDYGALRNAEDDEYERAERKREADERKQQSFDAALDEVLSTKNGRLVMWELLSRAGVYQPSFNREPLVMAYHEGARSLGIKLLEDLQLTRRVKLYNLMAQEAMNLEGLRNGDGE